MKNRFSTILILLLIPLFFAFTLVSSEEIIEDKVIQKDILPLPTGYNDLFAGSGECLQCHNSMQDAQGNDLSIIGWWKSSMMANAAKDPFWRAKVSFETIINPELQEEIESTCTKCHGPQGNFDAQHNGISHYSLAEMYADPLANDGVSCTVCHQIMEDSHGNFSANIIFNENHQIYGPYSDIFPNPMINHTGYTPVYSAHIKDSELCANCHTLLTPTVDLNGQLTGTEFVEQSIYQEWKNSESFQNGISCQDCHLPEIEESIVISSMPPWLDGQSPFGKHELVGGNVFMLKILRDHAEDLELSATPDDFDATIERTLTKLQEQSIDLDLEIINRDEDSLYLNLAIQNYAGHKIPSGYPSRQVFVQLEVKNENNEVIFLSGALDENHQIIDEDENFEPHYTMINREDQVQIYQTVMANVENQVTTTLMHADHPLKDNRLPPIGFSTEHPSYDTTQIVGNAYSDMTFNPNNQGGDHIRYHIPVSNDDGELQIEAKVYYQTVGSKWLVDMFDESSAEIDAFESMYNEADKSPVLMKSIIKIGQATTIIEREIPLFVYPNPSNGMVYLLDDENWDQVTIFQANGQIIRETVHEGNKAIRLPDASGIYYIQMAKAKEESKVYKVLRI